jgi:hypothetical protein
MQSDQFFSHYSTHFTTVLFDVLNLNTFSKMASEWCDVIPTTLRNLVSQSLARGVRHEEALGLLKTAKIHQKIIWAHEVVNECCFSGHVGA